MQVPQSWQVDCWQGHQEIQAPSDLLNLSYNVSLICLALQHTCLPRGRKRKRKKNVFSLIKLAPESCTYPEPRSMDLPTHYAVTCRGDWELLSVFQTMGQQTLSLKDQVVVNISSLAGCITSHIEYSDSLLLWVFFLSYLS